MIEINHRLNELEQNAGLSDQQLADALGLTRSLVNKHILGARKISLEHLVKYADFFNVTTDYLLGRTEVKGVPFDISILNSSLELLNEFIDTVIDLNEQAYNARCTCEVFEKTLVKIRKNVKAKLKEAGDGESDKDNTD